MRLAQCFVAVDDHDKALAFYCDVLGFEVRNDVGYEGMRWVTVASPSRTWRSSWSRRREPGRLPADKQAMAELLAKGLLRAVNFTTTDCDALFERVRAAGADVIQEPVDQPYGMRDCAFRDPAGNMVRFLERPAD
ncbi:VOC family protein [Streptomyces thermocarboxydus]